MTLTVFEFRWFWTHDAGERFYFERVSFNGLLRRVDSARLIGRVQNAFETQDVRWIRKSFDVCQNSFFVACIRRVHISAAND